MLIRGSFNNVKFTNFIEEDVLPHISSNDKILIDNARIHKSKHFVEQIKKINMPTDKFIYNVPYSPKYNPIKYAFNIKKENSTKSR
jgi:transposase